MAWTIVKVECEDIVNILGVVQVEQISKFTVSRPQQPLADAVITRRLLNARGWKLICISEHEWIRLKDLDEKIALLQGKLETAKMIEPSKEEVIAVPLRTSAKLSAL